MPRGTDDVASRYARARAPDTNLQTLQHGAGPTGPVRLICGLSEPKSQHLWYTPTSPLFTDDVLHTHPVDPAGSYDLSGPGTEAWMFEVIYTEWLGSPVSYVLSPDASLPSSVTSRQGCTEQCGACRTAGLGPTGRRTLVWIPDLHCMVSHLQTVSIVTQDKLNVVHAVFWALGPYNPTNITTTNATTTKHTKGTKWKVKYTQADKKKETRASILLFMWTYRYLTFAYIL